MEAWGRSRGSEGLVEASGGLEGGLAEAWERLGEAREMGKVRRAWRRLGEAWGMAWQRLGRRDLAYIFSIAFRTFGLWRSHVRRRRLQWKTNASSLGFHFRAGALELISGTKSAEQSCNRLSGVEGGGSLLTEARAIP